MHRIMAACGCLWLPQIHNARVPSWCQFTHAPTLVVVTNFTVYYYYSSTITIIVLMVPTYEYYGADRTYYYDGTYY